MDFDLRELTDGVTELWEPRLASKGLTFSLEIAADVPTVFKTDPTRVRQILFNLISNAVKFTEVGGVTMSVSHQALPDDQHELRFDVSDTGIGIPAEAHSRMFSKFSQADMSTTRKYGGTGLGLAICKTLAQLLGGDIGFESKRGEGSTFWFTVRCELGDPSAVKQLNEDNAGDESELSGSEQPLRILVAEDNTVNQMVVRAFLTKLGHVVDIVADGCEAVIAVQQAPYDLVLMDIHMPEMDGVQATGAIRGLSCEARDVPIVVLTANAMKGDREKYIAAGMDGYLSKPIDRSALRRVLATVTSKIPAGVA